MSSRPPTRAGAHAWPPRASLSVQGLNGATAIVRTLEACGVDRIVASPGSEWAPLWEALAAERAAGRSVPHYISVRHEEIAVAMAAGYAKATGRLPAIVLHSTVGALHGAMALRGALHERIPMIVLAGEAVGYGELPGPDPGAQWLNHLVDLGGPAVLVERTVRWAVTVQEATLLPATIQRAAVLARAAGGPAFVSVPMEGLFAEMTLDPPALGLAPPAVADPHGLDLLADRLVAAAAPLVVVEEAGADPAAVAGLVELAELLALPVFETRSARFVNFPRNHPLHGGFEPRAALESADLAVLLAIRAPWHPASRPPRAGLEIVVLDPDPLRLDLPYYGYTIDLALAGAIAPSLEGLIARVRARVREDTAAEARDGRRSRSASAAEARHAALEREARSVDEHVPFDVRWVSHEIARALPPGTVVVEETLTARTSIHQHIGATLEPGAFFAGAIGGLGTGLGTALGVKEAHRDRPVVCLIGDGSFHYDPAPAAFGAAQELDLPFLVIVLDNQGYLSQQRTIPEYFPGGHAARDGRSAGMSITPQPDYVRMAEAYGGWGAVVEQPDQIADRVREAMGHVAAGRLALLDIRLAPVASADADGDGDAARGDETRRR